jgi:hypothetical protein
VLESERKDELKKVCPHEAATLYCYELHFSRKRCGWVSTDASLRSQRHDRMPARQDVKAAYPLLPDSALEWALEQVIARFSHQLMPVSVEFWLGF